MINKKNIFVIIGILLFQLLYSQNDKIDSLKHVLSKTKVDSAKIRLYSDIAYNYMDKANNDSSIYYYKKALKLASIKLNYKYISKSNYFLGLIYLNKSFYSIAEDYLGVALNVAKEHNLTEYYINALNVTGSLYEEKLMYDKALKMYFEALKLSAKEDDKEQLAIMYNNIGVIYSNIKENKKAKEFLNKSFNLSKDFENASLISSYFTNIGLIYREEGDYEEAIKYINKSLEIDTKNNDLYSIAICYENLGDIYVDLKENKKAKEIYEKALEANCKVQALHSNASILIGLGNIEFENNNYEAAIEYYQNSLKTSLKIGAVELASKAYNKISECYKERKKFKQAYIYFQKYKKYSDSTIELKNILKLKEIEQKNVIEKEKKEYKVLQSEHQNVEKDLKKQKKQNYILYILLILLIIFIIFLVVLSIKLKRTNIILNYKKAQVEGEKKKTKNVEDALKIQEEHMKSFLQNANDFVLYRIRTKDTKKGELIFYSSSVTEVLGIDEPNKIENWYKNIHKDDIDRVLRANVDAGKRGVRFSERFRTFNEKKNKWIWINVVSSPIYNEKGVFEYLNGVIIDITETVELENAYKESEFRYKYLIENLSDGICINDKDENFILANKAVENIFGVKEGTLVGRNLKEFLSNENVKVIESKTKSRIQGEKDDYNIHIITEHGKQRLIQIKAIPDIKDAKIVGTIAIVRDITEEDEKNKIIAESEASYRALFDKNPVSLWEEDYFEIKQFIDKKKKEGIVNFEEYINKNDIFVKECISRYRVLNVNEETIRLLKVKSKEDFFKNANKFFTDKSISFFKEVLIAFSENKKSLSGELTLKDIKGKEINFQIKLFVLNNYKKVIVAMADISSIKHIENQLIIAKNEAENANKLKSLFLANMSHEIRTPLNAIIGFSDILYSRITNETHKSFIDKIILSGNNLLSLINDILDISKIEANELKIEKQPTNIKKIINEIAEIFSEKLNEKELKLNIIFQKDIPETVIVDELRIKQVISNLVGNAIKFTEKGGITISITANNISETKLSINFSVKDTGIGIKPNQLETIFDVFKQAEGQSTKQFGGTGLGLSISQNLVKLMGGTITVTSSERGSNFIVKLKDVEALPNVKDENNTDVHTIGNEVKILYADDNTLNMEVLKAISEVEGGEIIEAKNGKEVLDILENELPDIIVLDIQMPLLDGIETAKIIRANHKFDNIPIFSLSANTEFKGSELFDKKINKPISQEKFRNEILNWNR